MSGNILLPAVAALSVFLIYTLLMQMMSSRESIRERIKKVLGTNVNIDHENEYLIESLSSERAPSPFISLIASLFKWFGMDIAGYRTNNQIRFYQAGIRSPDAPLYYLFISRLLSIIAICAAIYIVTRPDAGTGDYAEALLAIFLGVTGADVVIKNRQEKRKQVLQRSFPDALDLLLACVEAGLALDGALLRVCKELGRAHPEITHELNRTRVELSLLNDRAQALNNLADRNGLPAFRALVTSLLQSEKFGTSLTDTLRIMSEDYRTQRLMKAEEKAGRLPALITIPLVMFLLPALFLIILGPAVLSVLGTFSK